jgi:hypothetical protein
MAHALKGSVMKIPRRVACLLWCVWLSGCAGHASRCTDELQPINPPAAVDTAPHAAPATEVVVP